MPELPEVETQRRGLVKYIIGRKIVKFETDKPQMFVGVDKDFAKTIQNKTFKDIDRKGKFLIFSFAEDEDLIMVGHYRMTGHFLLEREQGEYDCEKCLRGIFTLDNGWKLIYQDIRMFGRFWLGTRDKTLEASGVNRLAPDANLISEEEFLDRLNKKKGNIKSILLDQSFVAGIGNIYADESLFGAYIHPERRAESLTLPEKKLLYRSVKDAINAGIKHRGTTIGEYRDLENKSGTNQNYVKAYGQAGKPCKNCGALMQKIKVAQRGTTFCPHCQIKKK